MEKQLGDSNQQQILASNSAMLKRSFMLGWGNELSKGRGNV